MIYVCTGPEIVLIWGSGVDPGIYIYIYIYKGGGALLYMFMGGSFGPENLYY